MSGSPERVAGRSPARDATAKTGPGLKLAAVVAALALLLALGWLLPIGEWTIALADRVRGAGAAGVVLFIAAYVTATVALLPGSVLTLAAGFAYGPIGGLLVASPASVLAATAAFSWDARRFAAGCSGRSPARRERARSVARSERTASDSFCCCACPRGLPPDWKVKRLTFQSGSRCMLGRWERGIAKCLEWDPSGRRICSS